MAYDGPIDGLKPTVFPHGIRAVIVGSGGTQAAAITPLTDSSGGTASDAIAAVTAGASYAQADIVALKNAVASLSAKVNALNAVIKNAGLTA